MDPIVIDSILIASVAFFAALVQAATGFGFAIVALPFLLLIMGNLGAVGLTIMLNLLVSLVLVPGLWRQAPWGPLTRLSLGSVLGFPIGLAIFLQASLDWVRLAVGLVILFFAAWLALHARPDVPEPAIPKANIPAARPGLEILVGVLSGAMTTALAMPGPAVMLYLSASGMGKVPLRACTLCLFTLSYGAALALQGAADTISGQIWQIAALAALPTILGAITGNCISSKLDERLFHILVLAILLATGAFTTFLAILAW
ncbi:MAG: sulfite exporter TauE/SafE family protein [Proteobacteria bacterium]|nr:sulfite exporter TauE/SafE family protein [Pseudomonadota bacterium]